MLIAMLLVDGWGVAAVLLISYIHVAPLSKSIRQCKSFLAPSEKHLSNPILLLRQRNREYHDLIDAPQTEIAQVL